MDSTTGTPPSEFRIFQAGKNRTTKGDFNFTPKSAEAVMASAVDYGNDLSIDYNHAMILGGGDPANDSRAAGWFKPVIKNGELFATDVTWTPKAQQMLKDREFRYISPAFHHDKGEINRLLNVALVNMPATKGMTPIVASQVDPEPTEETEPPMLKNLVALLSLSDKATEAEALAEIGSQKSAFASLLSVTGKESASEALGVVAGWKEAAGQVTVLSQRIAALEAEKKDAEVKGFIEKAVSEGRATPAEVATLTALGSKDADMLKGLLSVRPVVMPAPIKGGDESKHTVILSNDEVKIAEMFGLTPEQYAKAKQSAPVIPTASTQKSETN